MYDIGIIVSIYPSINFSKKNGLIFSEYAPIIDTLGISSIIHNLKRIALKFGKLEIR